MLFFPTWGYSFYTNDTSGIMPAVNFHYNSKQWSLFIDYSKIRLKTLLLYNGNVLPSPRIAFSSIMKENNNTTVLLHAIDYSHHSWNICADFKVVTGIQ